MSSENAASFKDTQLSEERETQSVIWLLKAIDYSMF